MRFIRQEPAVGNRTVAVKDLGKPKAVPGGKWVEGSNLVTAWIPDIEEQEMGTWEERPMRHCSFCDVENHLEICLECSDIRGTDGKFDRICVQCDGHFNTSQNWQIICSYQCRRDRRGL